MNQDTSILEELQRLNKEMAKLNGFVMQIYKKIAQQAENDEYMTTRQAAQFLNRSPVTIRRWIQQNKLKAIKMNSGSEKDQYLIPKLSIEKLVKQDDFKD